MWKRLSFLLIVELWKASFLSIQSFIRQIWWVLLNTTIKYQYIAKTKILSFSLNFKILQEYTYKNNFYNGQIWKWISYTVCIGNRNKQILIFDSFFYLKLLHFLFKLYTLILGKKKDVYLKTRYNFSWLLKED